LVKHFEDENEDEDDLSRIPHLQFARPENPDARPHSHGTSRR